jgi:hypothetical protein
MILYGGYHGTFNVTRAIPYKAVYIVPKKKRKRVHVMRKQWAEPNKMEFLKREHTPTNMTLNKENLNYYIKFSMQNNIYLFIIVAR